MYSLLSAHKQHAGRAPKIVYNAKRTWNPLLAMLFATDTKIRIGCVHLCRAEWNTAQKKSEKQTVVRVTKT